MISEADFAYRYLLEYVSITGSRLQTRNAEALSSLCTNPVVFTKTPLVTLRKTAWKMALREMEWFMSGDSKCPEVLLPWWEKQLDKTGHYYLCGYGQQYREFRYEDANRNLNEFDQIAFLLDSLQNHPYSRRHILTAWNPGEMAYITEVNENPKTPTTCHSTMIQFFVREGQLHAKHYQRSADLLLGVPHNWIQHWALMLYLARNAGLTVGALRWDFGDAHIYADESHLTAVQEILSAKRHPESTARLCYNQTVRRDKFGTPEFLASDFSMAGDIPAPATTIKPKLFE